MLYGRGKVPVLAGGGMGEAARGRFLHGRGRGLHRPAGAGLRPEPQRVSDHRVRSRRSRGVPMGEGDLRASSRELHRARRLDLVHRRPESHGLQVHADGTLLKTLGTKDKPSDSGYHEAADLFERIATITHGGGPFNRPTGVAIAPSGEIYIADGYGNSRVHRFTADGELISSWGRAGPGSLAVPVASPPMRDKTNRVWVADRENHRVQIFREDGKFITQWTDLFRPRPSASTRTTSST